MFRQAYFSALMMPLLVAFAKAGGPTQSVDPSVALAKAKSLSKPILVYVYDSG